MTRTRMTLIATAIIMFATGYWGGYWHGRTWELYVSGKRWGKVPATMTWKEFLESNRKHR